MNFYKISRVFILCLLMLTASVSSVLACTFSAIQSSGCAGSFTLVLQDNTPGAGQTANWTVLLPGGNGTLHAYNNSQAQFPMNYPGQVQVTMTDTVGGVPCSATNTYTVNPKPQLIGSFSTLVACVGECVVWNDASQPGAGCSPLTYLIDYGQAPLVTQPNVCKRYSQNGVFHPSIVITNSCGCVTDTTFQYVITVTPAPSSSFSGTPLSSCTTPLTSTMTVATGSTNAKYYWYIDNGSGYTLAQVSGSTVFTHAYTSGVWSVRLVAIDSLSGCADSTTIPSYVSVGNNPGACFMAGATSGCAGYVTCCPCVVGASSYIWNFSNLAGSTANVTPSTFNNGPSNACVRPFFGAADTYKAQLIVTYNGGCIDTSTQIFTFDEPVQINFSTTDTAFCQIPQNVCVTYTGAACAACTYIWNPSPNTPTGLNGHSGTCYNITAYGAYSPVLTVTTPNGCSSSLVKTNYINAAPITACTNKQFANGRGCANDSIIVNNCSTGGPFASVVWSFPGANVLSSNDNQAIVSYPSTGCNNYSLVVRSVSGCVDTLRDSICVGSKITNIQVTVDPHDICFESQCNTFTVIPQTPADSPTSVKIWPMGYGIPNGGNYFNVTNPHRDTTLSYCYTYPSFGDFAFCYLTNNRGCLGDTVCLTASLDSVHIHPPSAQFRAVVSCRNTDSVLYINQSKGYSSFYWTFQGVNYPNQDSLYVVFPQCGVVYPISLTATNDTFNCTLTKSDTTAFVPCYGVDFAMDTTHGCFYSYVQNGHIFYTTPNALVPNTIIWDAEPASIPPAPIFVINQNDTGRSVRYNLYVDHIYDMCVQFKYTNGCIDTLCKPNYIDISRPIASYTVSDSAGCLPFCVQFTSTSTVSYGTLTHFYWTFGDLSGITDSVNPNPNHCYTTVGQFQACLTIIDSNGCSSIYCKQMQSNNIVANFTTSDSITCTQNASPLNPITYNDASTGFVSTYSWILPAALGPVPATQGSTSSITEQFTNQGYGQICMVAIDQFGTCRDTVCKPVHVANPIADYSLPVLADTSFPCPPLVINPFVDLSRNNICSRTWYYGDGTPGDVTDSGAHVYTIPGTYCVKQVVTSCHGCVDSITKYCMTINGPHVKMTCSQPGGCPCLPVTFQITDWNADSLICRSNGGIPVFTTIAVVNRGTITRPDTQNVTFLYCSVGDVNPSVFAIDNSSSCNVLYDNLILAIPIDTPTVNFSYVRGGCGSDSICFTKLTSYVAPHAHDSIYLWNFGDGTTSTLANPCHHYATHGDYVVKLTVTDNVQCSSYNTQNVHVPSAPVARYVLDDSVGCLPLVIHFMDSSSVDDSTSIVSGYWNFGDGVFANTTADTSHQYNAANTYTATLVITDGYGCTDSTSHTIFVQPPPAISIGPGATICLGDTATLSGSGSSTLTWIPNYNISDTLAANPRVWPRVDTCYILRVGVIPRCYVFDTVCINVSTITISQDTSVNLCLGQVTTFTGLAQTTHATISSYLWNFGDGASGSGASTTHLYSTYGNYMDTLIAINSIGCRDTAIKPVTISDHPHAALSISIDSVCLGAPVTVTNLSTAGAGGTLSTFYFDMQSNGTPDFTTSPVTYTYPAAGSNTILLVQSDNSHCLDSARQIFVVHALPQANFNNDTTCIGEANTFTSNTTIGDGSITLYNWTLNGTGIGTNANSFTHVFPDSGSYVICLNVQDVYGCVDTNCKNVQVFSSPLDTVSPLDTTICAGYSASFNVSGPRFDHVQWVPSTWVDNPTGTSVTITPKQTIRYQVYSYFRQCTPKIDTVNIWVIDSVPVSATADPENIVLGLSSNVTSTVKGTIDSIVWDPDATLNCRNCRNPIATPTQTTTYNATVYYSKNGVVCSNRTSVTITVYKSCDNSLIYVPNTFTPNGDGKNDAFRLRGQGIAKVNYFRVFDRWGKVVYEATNVDDTNNAAWNGCLHNDLGSPENSGVYVYVFEIQCITGNLVTGKGNVTLIR